MYTQLIIQNHIVLFVVKLFNNIIYYIVIALLRFRRQSPFVKLIFSDQ